MAMETKTRQYTPTVMEVVRRQKGITQADIADRLGRPQNQISHYETGKATPNNDVRKVIAEMLDVDPDDLLRPYVPELNAQER